MVKLKEASQKVEKIAEEFSTFCNGFTTGLFDGLKDIFNTEDLIFNVCHAQKDGDLYRVSKEVIAISNKCEQDRVYTEKEFEDLEERAIKWFTELKDFASMYQWELYHGVQFNLIGNSKLYGLIQELSNQGNIYAKDFLIFDLIQMGQYVDDMFLNRAKELYLSIEDPSILPLNYVYRAVLLNGYAEFVKNEESYQLFNRCFEWNMSPVKLVQEINRQGLTFEDDESIRMKKWLVEATLKEC